MDPISLIIFIAVGGVLIGAGVHFIPVGGAPAAGGEVPGYEEAGTEGTEETPEVEEAPERRFQQREESKKTKSKAKLIKG